MMGLRRRGVGGVGWGGQSSEAKAQIWEATEDLGTVCGPVWLKQKVCV